MIEPQTLDEDAIERLADQMRQPAQRRADLRAQLAANRTGVNRLKELHERMPLAEAMEATIDYAERRTRAAIEDARGRHARRDRRPRGRRRRPDAVSEGHRRRRRAAPGLHRHRRPARRQPQLPAGGHRLRLLVRRPRAHRPGHPAVQRRDAPGDDHRARGLPAEREAAGGGRRGQRRDVVAGRRPRPRRVRPRARPGHDEQPHARQRRLHLLRDARRRPGRLRGRRRPERRARGDVEHAQHAGRGARAGVPAAGHRPTRSGAAPAATASTAAATA